MANQYGKTTLYDWCIQNDRQDVLEYWDYELNDVTPKDIGFQSNKKYWFKCKRHLHESYLKGLVTIKNSKVYKTENYFCPKCNSFGQYIIDTFGNDYLDMVWSSKNELSPFDYSKASAKKVWFKCLDDDTHQDYCAAIYNFLKGSRCPCCGRKQIAKNESLGDIYTDVLDVWSDKNDKTPFDFSCCSNQGVWLKCKNNKHDDYKRKIYKAVATNFACPLCLREEQKIKNRMMAKEKYSYLIGKKIGRLEILDIFTKDNKESFYVYAHCICCCSEHNETNVLVDHLLSGKIQSCGCLWKESITGENNSQWKGGITSKLAKLRQSKEHKDWQKAVYEKDWYTCQCCGNGRNLRAHHILNFSDHEDLRFDVTNGITLCKECHDIKGGSNSFHILYGTKNNTPEQLEEYINNRRKQLGVEKRTKYGVIKPFTIKSYLNGNVLKPNKTN